MSQPLLEVIKTCEDYQNSEGEGHEIEQELDDARRTICKVIVIANGALAEIKARENAVLFGQPPL